MTFDKKVKIKPTLNLFLWLEIPTSTVLQAKGDSDVMLCLQSYQGLRIDRPLVY